MIPGRIEAENYDSGAEGTTYHDTTPANLGGQYRADGVDINPAPGGGYTVGYTEAGEWLKYTTTVQTTGTYTTPIRTANGSAATQTIHLELDGTNVGSISVPPTGGYGTETTISGPTPNLTAGSHTLKIVFDTGLIDLNYLDVTLSSTPTPSPSPTPCSILTPTSLIPTGFGSPFDVVSSPSTNLIATTCDGSSVRVDLGKGDPLQYIYNQGYIYKFTSANWTSVPYTSTESLISGAWYPKTANATIPMTSQELNNTSYILGYLCTWTGSQWKCGCRDASCTQSYWQLQEFKR